MKFQGWETFGKNLKPIHWWIRHRKGEPILEELKFQGWETFEDNIGDKPIHWWVKFRPDESIPEDL